MAENRPNHSILIMTPKRHRRLDPLRKPTSYMFPVEQRNKQTMIGNSKSSLYKSIGFIITLAQCFSLMPFYGAMGKDISCIKFKWFSPKMIYSIFGICGSLLSVILYIAQFSKDEKEFSDIVNIVFFLSASICGGLFILLARQWYHLNEKWFNVEYFMRNYPNQPNIKKRFLITTSIIMILALGEHILSIFKKAMNSHTCPISKSEPIKAYFGNSFSHLFSLVPFNGWYALFMEMFLIMATFIWNFTDLFVILMCSALAERFKQINKRIKNSEMKNETFWKEIREDYTRLSTLCKTLDGAINHIVTVTFGNNLFFICVQLFHTLKPFQGPMDTAYFVCSFGFLLGRTAAVSAYCCWINDESKKTLAYLFEIPSEDFGVEASRLIQQISFCPVVITGSNYFAVTRGLCLQLQQKQKEIKERAKLRKKSDSNLHNSIEKVLIIAQCFGLMPVIGVTSSDLTEIRFEWCSFRSIYSIANLCGAVVLLVMNIIRYLDNGMHFGDIVTVVYYCAIVCTILLFIRIARKWHNFMDNWYHVELIMKKYEYQPKLSRKFKLTMCIVMSVALGEHLLFISKTASYLHMCPSFKTDPIRTYFGVAFAQIFTITPFAYWKAIILEFLNVLSTFAWNFMDLFVILTCSAMAQSFRQINNRVANTKIHDEHFWKEIRKDYNKLVHLCRNLDDTINHLISLCLFNDLFFITVQLFRTLRPLSGVVNCIYFFCSFGFLMGRTAIVCANAASINDESKVILNSLFSVSSEYFGIEADRLITQISLSPAAITGSNFVDITRDFCLKVAGTIITFEVILQQVGPVLFNTEKPGNDEPFCIE